MDPGNDDDLPFEVEGPRLVTLISELYPFGKALETRGLGELGHSELQVVLDLDEENAAGILRAAAGFILEGGCFLPGKAYRKILRGAYEVMFVRAMSPLGLPVLRLIIPDHHNRLERGRMAADYGRQYDLLDPTCPG